MAKATTRVHLLAKELGVNSKAIIEKCQAEGLDIKNHMSTISIGLAATIREWFSEGEHTTTVETAERVDLKEVRVRKPRKKSTKKLEEEVADDSAPEKAEAAPAAEVSGKLGAVAVDPGDAVERVTQPEETSDEADAEITEEPQENEKPQIPEIYEPPKLEDVVPAGPMLTTPKPAKLAGPRVIRVEEPEPHQEIRRRRPARSGSGPARPRYDQPISQPLMQPAAPAADQGGKRGKGRKHGKAAGTEEEIKKGKAGDRKMRSRDLEDRRARLAAARGEGFRARPSRRIESKRSYEAAHIERPEKATIAEPITVKELSSAIAVKTSQIIGKLMAQGVMATANQTIAVDMAELISLEFGTELIVERKQTLQQIIEQEFESRERKKLKRRPPVIAMLGHVDHGKTSLLDKIRSTSVAEGEAGGITQHIGASHIEWKNRSITFLDTPGHEAFTAMRARGANMTDVVVLVVAADDGLMPQTIEAIHHVKAAGVEMIVALNKIDLPGVDINRIYGQLAEHEMTPTEWGGEIEVVKTSATTGEGIEDLLEHLDYIAELKDYKADSTIPATGWVIEAKMTPTQGAVATVLVKEGVLNKSGVIFAGNGYGRVRTLKDSRGKSLKKATSSMAVEISGLSDVPQAGDKFFCLDDINKAKDAADQNRDMDREKSLAQRSQITLDNLFSQIEAGNVKDLNLIIKADVQGSVDVLIKYLSELTTEEIKINILHAAVGGVTEGDVVLAHASGAIIIGFNVIADEKVKAIADDEGVDIRLYSIIYRITEDLKDAMLGLLDAKFEEKQIGKITVRDTFRHSRVGTIAGCFVNTGSVFKNSKLRLIRDGIIIRDKCGIDSLKHFKDDAKEVKAGNECGVKIAGFDDIKVGDVFEAYEVVELERKL